MKRYSEYKDSGVKWIGEIPRHWNCCKLKYFTRIKSGDALTNNALSDTGKYKVYGGGDFMGFYDKYNVDANTILIGRVGARCGCVTITEEKAWATDNALILIHFNINTKFLTYLLVAANLNSLSISNAQPLITGSKVKDSFIPIPPIPEQEAIVSYLDSKVAKIDEYISIAEKKIAALEELKQTIIAEAVTRGIHKDVPMKDSGVKWIGMIPEHWKVMRLSQIAYEHFISNKKIHHQNLLSLSYGQIIRKDINGTNGLLPASFDTYQVVEEGNIILRLTDLQNDHKSLRVGLVKETGIITSAYLCLASKNMVYSKFLYFQLHACDIKKVFYSMGDGLRQSLNYDGMRKLASVIPPLPEQQEIVTYIEAKVANINQLCQAERSQIEKLKEYKQRLISDVVTGKVKVTND